MSECELYQAQAEPYRRGALDRAEASLVEEHLSGCAPCTDFDAVTRELEEVMQGAATGFVKAMDWERVQEQVSSVRSDYGKTLRRMTFGWVGLTLGLVALAAPSLSEAWPVGLRSSLIAAVIVLACFEVGPVYALLRFREAGSEGSPEELLGLLRRELDRRMRRIRIGRALSSALAVGVLAGLAWISSVLSGSANDSLWLAIVVPAGLFGILPALAAWREPLAELRRERAELD